MSSINVQSLIVGILVMLSLYLSLSLTFGISDRMVKKPLALFCAAAGILTTLWLNQHPSVLEDYLVKIVGAGIAVVLALLIFAKKSVGRH